MAQLVSVGMLLLLRIHIASLNESASLVHLSVYRFDIVLILSHDFHYRQNPTVRLSKKNKEVNGVLPSDARRTSSGVGFFRGIREFGEHFLCTLRSPVSLFCFIIER